MTAAATRYDGQKVVHVTFMVTMHRTKSSAADDEWETIGEWACNTLLSASMTPGGSWTSIPQLPNEEQRPIPRWSAMPAGVTTAKSREKRGRRGLPGRVLAYRIERMYELPIYTSGEVEMELESRAGRIKRVDG
jgi:hypothetical protein